MDMQSTIVQSKCLTPGPQVPHTPDQYMPCRRILRRLWREQAAPA